MATPEISSKDWAILTGNVPDVDFIEKLFHWGLCYGLLDRRRMACIIIKGGPEARRLARDLIGSVNDGCIQRDEYTRQVEVIMRKWEIEG